MQCPVHKEEMWFRQTSFGMRHACPIDGCTVVCWNGKTSTPADAETRALRHQCHQLFDLKWRPGKKIGKMSRRKAYGWLRHVMDLTAEEAHIGRFSKEQCEKLLAILESEN